MAPTIVAEDRLTSGHRLSHPPAGDEVLITGVSGYFPDSDSVMHLQENLFNKVDLVSDDARRWKSIHPEIPQRTGKINNLSKFDASFFKINFREAHGMDPVGRILLEKAYEAIYDAGVNPEKLRGTKMGVFIGSCYSEATILLTYKMVQENKFGLTGCSKAMLANRISYWLGVTGPSYAVDTACSSSLYALEHAFRAMRDGQCDSAIVGGTNLCLNPSVSLQFSRLGVLSPDGSCKSFDNSANGYARSETIACIFLQKAKNSIRAYAQVVYAKSNCDGYKEQGITYPAGQIQKLLLSEFYEECSIPPHILEFVEAHGTGTRVGDPEELQAIDEIFCRGRSEPLKIGSVKSNLGHSEPASGICSIAKLCIAYATGYIPPNINFITPREEVAALTEKRLEVVYNKTPWQRGMSGVSNFGFGGANAHVLLKNFANNKVNNGMPFDDLPRLVCVSGRTESAVARILDELESRTVDVELVRMLHSIHEEDIKGHVVRGYSLLSSTPEKSVSLARDVQYFSGVRRPVLFVYSGMGSQWAGMAAELMRIPVFAATIHKCHKALEHKDINLMSIFKQPDPKIYDDIHISSVGAAAVQIGLTDVLKAVGIEPDHTVGHDVGKLICMYAAGVLTAEQTILKAYDGGPEYSQSAHVLENVSHEIQLDAILIDISPNRHMQIRKISEEIIYVPLLQRNENSIIGLLNALGQLYQAGVNPQLANMYPHVPLPVSQGTPMLAHLVEWDHSDDWTVKYYKRDPSKVLERTVKISLSDQSYEYMAGHIIDGRLLIPGTGYLELVWETFGLMMGQPYTEVSVVFENVRFERATKIPLEGYLEFIITIQKGSGNFEIVERGSSVASGNIYAMDKDTKICNEQMFQHEEIGSDNLYLQTKDFYKELRLRGYNHSGLFRGVLECNQQGTHGRVSWLNNWVTFLDCILQMKILSEDTRSLYIPVRINKLAIDTNLHHNETSKMNPYSTNNFFEFKANNMTQVIKCGGVTIDGIHKSPINRKLPLGVPVLEKNVFAHNFGKNKLKINDVLRIYIQIVLENVPTYNVKSIELEDKEYKLTELQPILDKVGVILEDVPMVQAELLLISEEENIDTPKNIVVNKTLQGESNAVMLIGANLFSRSNVLQQAAATLRNKGFIISREKNRPDPNEFSNMCDIICVYDTGDEYLVLFRKKISSKPVNFYKVMTSDQSYDWIDKVKKDLKIAQKIVLYNQDEPINGLLGLVNCLRKEPGGEIVCGLLIADSSAPAFNPDLEFYKEQLDKDLAINVYQDGQWGTYRHLLLDKVESFRVKHAFVDNVTIGDLTTLRWMEGPLTDDYISKDGEDILVQVYCAALNFRDVMTAMGRVHASAVARGRLAQECLKGIEVAGKTPNGTRVMSMTKCRGLSNLISGYKELLLPVPDEWTMEEAATVPVAYSTAYYAMVMVGKMQRGESILIHAGSGGVGQAAINVALHFGCEVFTTVGTAEKRAFIKNLFPQIKDSHIGNSRDTSFEDMVKRETNGKGVDLVLNSLSGDKLQASIRCLGSLGRFLEIGKFDISNNTLVDMSFFGNEISFHSIMLDYILDPCFQSPERQKLRNLILTGIESGAVRPLTYCNFNMNEVESAFRYMAAGNHIGKVIIKVRNDHTNDRNTKPASITIDAMPRYMCHEEHVYIVVGGLGGFGLELADWLILRGARKVMLVSRRGVVNGYQASRLSAWSSYGAIVQISTDDITTEAGCEAMLRAANDMGPVHAIFNLAVVLKDFIFQNQTPETFRASYGPKALVTLNLDKFSKRLCPGLKDFVVFSSVSCGRGNAGQTNYGFSNSVMERICENRKNNGLPALAVQWGAIGYVGLVADMQDEDVQLEIGGTLQQRISSCLLALDKFMKQDAAIVSSIVVAEKKVEGSGCGNIVDAVTQIMGIKDMQTVSHQVCLAELGMDSMMAVEIKQTLEREFGIFLAAEDIRNLTFAKLVELSTENESSSLKCNDTVTVDTSASLKLLIRNFGDENIISMPFIYIPTISPADKEKVHESERAMFMLPGIEGTASTLKPLCVHLKMKTCVLQLGIKHRNENLDGIVTRLYQVIKSKLKPRTPFWLLGYSFGSLLALELASKLETDGHNGTVFCVDGSPEYNNALLTNAIKFTNDHQLQNELLCHAIDLMAPNNNVTNSLMIKLRQIYSLEEKVDMAFEASPPIIQEKYSKNFITGITYSCFDRFKVTLGYNSKTFKKLKSPIVLIRTKDTTMDIVIEENYGLDKFTEDTVKVHYLEGNHATIINNEDVANVINKAVAASDKHRYRKLK